MIIAHNESRLRDPGPANRTLSHVLLQIGLIFLQEQKCDVIIDCFKFCIKNKGMILFGYVIISNHIHLVVQSGGGKPDLIRDFTKFTANKL